MRFKIYFKEQAANDTIRRAVEDLEAKAKQEFGGNSTGVDGFYFHRDEYGVYLASDDWIRELPPRLKQFRSFVTQVRFYDEFPGEDIELGVYELLSTKANGLVEERFFRATSDNEQSMLMTRVRITAPTVEGAEMLYSGIRRGELHPTEPWLGRRRKEEATA